MTENKPKRRWFRFSLRTLFVLVTLLAMLLGYGVHVLQVVHLRSALRGNLEKQGWRFIKEWPVLTSQGGPGADHIDYVNASIPWTRQLVGDQPYSAIEYPYGATDDIIDQAKATFPEAVLRMPFDQMHTGLAPSYYPPLPH